MDPLIVVILGLFIVVDYCASSIQITPTSSSRTSVNIKDEDDRPSNEIPFNAYKNLNGQVNWEQVFLRLPK